MAGSRYERVLAAEWLAVFGVETLDALAGADTGTFALPDPARYFATMVVFLMLAAAAMFGDRAGKLAAAFGGVAGLTILLAPGKEGHSPVIGAVNYFDKLLKGGGPAGPPNAANAPGFGNVAATGSTPGYNYAPVPPPAAASGGPGGVPGVPAWTP